MKLTEFIRPDLIRSSQSLKIFIGFISIALVPLTTQANSPELQTPEPVIHLSDNLDEKDKLGWCIDTKGRGFSEQLHAHSCKPQGGDVQFYFNKKTRQIVSATYAGKCATLLFPAADGVSLGLVDCSPTSSLQLFTYDRDSSEIRPTDDLKLCLVVGATSQSAGPFMSRSLELGSCDAIESKYKQWQIKGEVDESMQ